MRALSSLVCVAFLSLTAPAFAQTGPTRDPQATLILQKAVEAMGGVVPSDSTATGDVSIVEGSKKQDGTIEILTRGTDQTAEEMTLPDGQRETIYSDGDAKEVNGTQATVVPLELSVTDQCADFPLPLLTSILNNPDEAYQYVGQETLGGQAVLHVRVWDTFASNSNLQQLAPFTTRDIWFDATSLIPVKIKYLRRPAGGQAPAFRISLYYVGYANWAGVLYPTQIKKTFDGTPWQTITIQNVTFNTGLPASDFSVE